MPAEKQCPKCGVKHKKRGPFCSRSCGNGRVHSVEDKRKRSIKLKEYNQTPEAQARNARLGRELSARLLGQDTGTLNADDYYIEIPDLHDKLDDFDENWQRGSNW